MAKDKQELLLIKLTVYIDHSKLEVTGRYSNSRAPGDMCRLQYQAEQDGAVIRYDKIKGVDNNPSNYLRKVRLI